MGLHWCLHRSIVVAEESGAALVSRNVSPIDAEKVYQELGRAKNPPLNWLFDWREIDR